MIDNARTNAIDVICHKIIKANLYMTLHKREFSYDYDRVEGLLRETLDVMDRTNKIYPAEGNDTPITPK